MITSIQTGIGEHSPGRSEQRRVPLRIQFSPSPTRYNRSNWAFETRGDGWSELTEDFINSLAPEYISRGYTVLSYQFSYLNVRDTDSIADPNRGFLQYHQQLRHLWPGNVLGSESKQDIRFMDFQSCSKHWHTGSTGFHNNMRIYAQQHNMWLFD